MGSRGNDSHNVRDFRQRRNASDQSCKYRDHRCKFSSFHPFPQNPTLKPFTGRFGCSRVRGEAETARTGTGDCEGETEGGRKGERAYVIGVLFHVTRPGPERGRDRKRD